MALDMVSPPGGQMIWKTLPEAGTARAVPASWSSRLGGLEADGRGLAPTIGFQFVRDALVLIERAHAGAFDGRNVDEGIAAAVFRRDEAITLVIVEEFYGTGDHEDNPYPCVTGMRQQRHIPAS